VHGEIDATVGERLFNLHGEHAFGANLGKGDFLQAIAGGFYDLNFDSVTLDAQQSGDMIGLPEGELRSATANAKLHLRVSTVFGAGFIARCIYKSVSQSPGLKAQSLS
jgi:hypothetical protein